MQDVEREIPQHPEGGKDAGETEITPEVLHKAWENKLETYPTKATLRELANLRERPL
ncbi:MAG: hypothetical protein HY398_01150 [Candidatus Doudnabacteria bacterium]|nr:hypothetical protein [Candidatus Doudnabacteria bacterium]